MRHIVTFALVMAILLGVGLGGMELWHLSRANHPFNHWPFVWAGALILFPALALQKGDIGASITVVGDNLPIIAALRGGRRATDPMIPVPVEAVKPDAVVVVKTDPPPANAKHAPPVLPDEQGLG